jgi:tetratricopeptide (TPR) repeat protein
MVLEMPDAPVDQKVQALFNRGITYGMLGDSEQAILDYTMVVEMPDAPVDQKVRALVNRAWVHDQQNNHKKAVADLDKAIRLDPDDALTRLFRVESLMYLKDWDEAFKSLEHTLQSFSPSTTGEAGNTATMISLISQQTASKWHQLVPQIVEVYQHTDALEFLGKGLVASLGTLQLSAESLVSWERIWHEASDDLSAMHVPMRLFTVGVRYLQSVGQAGGDERLLYDLPMEEASILRHALGLESPSD